MPRGNARVATWASELTFLACSIGDSELQRVASSELQVIRRQFSIDLRTGTLPICFFASELSQLLHSELLPASYRGKDNGMYILQSIDHGLFDLGTTRDILGTTPEGGVLLGPERPRTYDDLNDNEKKRFDADVRATNIVLQGLPKDIYKLINHNIKAKAIWDNVKMLLAGSELIKKT
ncbi:hypothetical protein Tco_1062767 [Tanacetum coccineum]